MNATNTQQTELQRLFSEMSRREALAQCQVVLTKHRALWTGSDSAAGSNRKGWRALLRQSRIPMEGMRRIALQLAGRSDNRAY